MDKLKSIYASAWSSTLTIIVVVGITVGGELSFSFKDWLTAFTGHHWITKSWLSVISFVVFFLLFKIFKQSADEKQTKTALNILQIFIILGFIAILGFYFYEFFI